MNKKLHIVSFDVPYPPNYGGIIDIYYKILELNKLGIEIYLHTYIFGDSQKQEKLNQICKNVFYYKKTKKISDFISKKPFRIKSRINLNLIKNLQSINAPILFEGLHTTFPLINYNFKNVYVRAHNIEHFYFDGIAKSENNIFKKLIYQLEAFKLKKFENYLTKVNGIFAISPFEFDYFEKQYDTKTHYIPVFHKAEFNSKKNISSDYILYHGDLRVSDNIKTALFFIEVYKNTPYKLIIASSQKVARIEKKASKYKNIFIQNIKSNDELAELIQNANINVIYTFQKTGIKLKLLNVLYNGKHILANTKITEETGLEEACSVANTCEEFLEQTAKLFQQKFTNKEFEKRKELLKQFNPEKSAKKIIDIIYSN